jgi:hypothetical protein
MTSDGDANVKQQDGRHGSYARQDGAVAVRSPACAENLIRPGGRSCSGSAEAALAGCSSEVCSLRHDDRLCCFDWLIWV